VSTTTLDTTTVRGWKRYPEYRPGGADWLPELPRRWETRRLKYLAMPSRQRIFEKPQDATYIGLEQIESGTGKLLLDNPVETVESNMGVFEPGNVLFGKLRPYLAKVAAPTFAGVCTTEVIVYLPGPDVHSDYLKYQLLSREFIDFVNTLAYGTKMPRVNEEQMGEMRLALPPLPEQRAITAFLDRETARIDSLIERKERLITLLEEKRLAVINHAVTRGLDPTTPLKDSGIPWLGKVPKHWTVERLKGVSDVLRGKFTHRPRNDPRLYDGPFPFIQTGDVATAEKYITSYSQTLNEEGYSVSKEFPSRTVVMAIAANVGDVAILTFNACFPDSVVGFFPSARTHPDFLYYQLSAMRQEMLRTATMNTQLNLNIERISSLNVTMPPIEEQGAIARQLDCLSESNRRLASSIRDGIARLQEYRAALISAAVTGQIDVRAEVTP
jgi:type I restriction enzyme S subunit